MSRLYNFIHRMITTTDGRSFPDQVKINNKLYNFKACASKNGFVIYKYEYNYEDEAIFILTGQLLRKIRIKHDELEAKRGKIHPIDYILKDLAKQ